MASTTESSLLSKLESSNSTPIYPLFSDYLRPFKDTKKHDHQLLRTLAKRFLPFLNKCLSVIPKRLSDSHLQRQLQPDFSDELFRVYGLCLNSLELICSQLSCKPYSIEVQRVRFVHCLEAHGKHAEAESEGFRVLERLNSMDFEGKATDAEFAKVLVETVAILVKCAAVWQRKDLQVYKRVLQILETADSWFRVLDTNAYEKLHRVLVSFLSKCALFLIGEMVYFREDLVCAFSTAVLNEYGKSSALKDQLYKFSRQMCSSLFSQQEIKPLLVEKIVVYILDYIARLCKAGMDDCAIEFTELVAYCANKCRTASTIFSGTFAGHLSDIAAIFSQVKKHINLIVRLYSLGLCAEFNDVNHKGSDLTSSSCTNDEGMRLLLDNEDRFHELAELLASFKTYFQFCFKEKSLASPVACGNSVFQVFLQPVSCHGGSTKCTDKYREGYFNALKFLCQPLAELVNLNKKEIVAEIEAASPHWQLCIIQDAFEQYCDVFTYLQSCLSEKEKDRFNDSKAFLTVAVAAFILSVATNSIKKSTLVIKHIISSQRIPPQDLKYLFGRLYNIGVLLYRNKQLKEASKALKLCCGASWTCVVLLCNMFVQRSKGLPDDLSEGAIADFVNEACRGSALLLDVLHQCGNEKVQHIILESLESWSVAENLLTALPGPMVLVKQWVKIHKNADVSSGDSTLYSLLSSSDKLSRQTIGIILEQELRAYEEVYHFGSEICQRKQMEICNILLQNVYITQDNCLQNSRILLRKGRVLRAKGNAALKDCINYLSDAISMMKNVLTQTQSYEAPLSHELAVTYCLRALCTQEEEPNSKQVIQDIDAAINLWLSILIPVGSEDDVCNMFSDYTILLLYNIIDLLSVKGSLKFHQDIYNLLIRLLKWKNTSMEKCLALLWESRRLNHALCVSPVCDAFITSLAEHCGELCTSVNFWIDCLKEFQPLLVGFQQTFFFLFADIPHGSISGSSFKSFITIDDIKQTASVLCSSVPMSPRSVFLVGYLYYDLCENLISNGRVFEALSYAKEAHQLRTQLFRKKFSYSVAHQAEEYNVAGKIIKKLSSDLKSFEVVQSVASDIWDFDNNSREVDSFYLSPWNVLKCYLESLLQVGVIHELIGNGDESESLLLWGKSISCSQSLPSFTVTFSSILGKLYCKQQIWQLAEKELTTAKQILKDKCSEFSCLKCKLMLEATVDQQLGDLSQSYFETAAMDPDTNSFSMIQISKAEELYKLALDKLNCDGWKNLTSCPEDAHLESMFHGQSEVKVAQSGAGDTSQLVLNQPEIKELPTKDSLHGKMERKKGRKPKPAPKVVLKEQLMIPEHNSRITRSKSRSAHNQCATENKTDLCDNTRKKILSEVKDSNIDVGSEASCIYNKMKCWQCLFGEVTESALLDNFVCMKWEFVRRRLSLRLLNAIGKCMAFHDQIHETHENLMQGMHCLMSRNTFKCTCLPTSLNSLLNLIGKQLPGDIFAIERAALLYNICWFSLRYYHLKGTRNSCCDLCHVPLEEIVSLLKLAFVLSREVPVLVQKVSRLLAIMYVLSAASKLFSLSSSCKVLSESHWASFFHQASLGTHHNYQFCSHWSRRLKVGHIMDSEDLCVSGSVDIASKSCNLPRIAPESIEDLDQFVKDFFVALPCTTIIGLNLLGGAYCALLKDLLLYPSCIHAWVLLSRLNSKSQPAVLLLPVDTILEVSDDESDENSDIEELDENNDNERKWHWPWGFTVVDHVAPEFKLIIKENHLSSTASKTKRSLWWMRRMKLDRRFDKFLSKLEDLWLGSWKYILLGEWSNYKNLSAAHKKLSRDLKSKCKMNVDENLLRVILGGLKCGCKFEEYMQLCCNKGCYIGTVSDEDRCKTPSVEGNGVKRISDLACQLMHEAMNDLKDDTVNREPTVLVLDSEVQMLPWESIPVLRNQEVYRMPSVGSISATLERIHHHQEQLGRLLPPIYPRIDPLDAFYLLNPSGDLKATQADFEDWFRDQNLELQGKAGSAPTAEELALALKSHDLYLYFGHGSGSQYISRHHILELEKCAASFLMGCSSGSLLLNGSYIPQGTHLYFLLAGSPIIIANLWDVTDKDIDRFGKVILDACLQERSSQSMDCDRSSSLEEEFKNLNVKGNKTKVSRKRTESSKTSSCNDDYDHRPKLGSFMGRARQACKLPFLIGAAPVCYGVPTGIIRKIDL